MYGCIRRKRGKRSESRDIPLPLPLRKALIYTQASSLGTTSWKILHVRGQIYRVIQYNEHTEYADSRFVELACVLISSAEIVLIKVRKAFQHIKHTS